MNKPNYGPIFYCLLLWKLIQPGIKPLKMFHLKCLKGVLLLSSVIQSRKTFLTKVPCGADKEFGEDDAMPESEVCTKDAAIATRE